MSLKMVEVEPIGSSCGIGHGEGGCQIVDIPLYPRTEEAKCLRELRIANGVTLREGADVLGISVVELSSLERGRLRLADSYDWKIVYDLIECAAEIRELRAQGGGNDEASGGGGETARSGQG